MILGCGCFAHRESYAATQVNSKPSIIIVFADDMGLGDLSCYGGTLADTPRIDELARDGIRFTQYYSSSPICSPSRAGLITGIFPGRLAITSYLQDRRGNRGCEQVDFLDPKAVTLPRLLQTAGYKTAHFGKWHLGGGRDVTDAPKFAEYGYDEHAGTYESPEPHADITGANWIWSDKDNVKRWGRTRFFVDKTLDFVSRHKTKPCFVNLWLDDVHTPWIPGPQAPTKESLQNLKRVLVDVDKQIGRLMDGLVQLGLSDSTLVIFTSDNGPLPSFEGQRCTGLRGSKLSLYEGGIRMPFLARWPGHIPAHRVDQQTVLASVDILPTLCAISGAKLSEVPHLDGEDMSGSILGHPRTRQKPMFWEYGRNNDFFKYPKVENDHSPNLAIRDGRWKLLIQADGTRAELYDLDHDKYETTNLAGERTEIANRLSRALLTWRRSLPTLDEYNTGIRRKTRP
jgi:arylsulfatase A-like enzyme